MEILNIKGGTIFNIEVQDTMFGANLLFVNDRPGSGTFDEAYKSLGATSVRYPGGSMTEEYFDVVNPDRTSATGRDGKNIALLPLSSFISWMASEKNSISIVLPTRELLTNGAAGKRTADISHVYQVGKFVTALLDGQYGNASIFSFEIGNEYWGSGEMSALEYGRVASALALEIQRRIDEYQDKLAPNTSFFEPRIAVQMGAFGIYSPQPSYVQNQIILQQFNQEEADAVDAVIGHYYLREALDISEKSGRWMFDRLDEWSEDRRFRDVDYLVTEWNVGSNNDDVTGLLQAAALISMFGRMVANEVDGAWVWPVQHNTNNDLAGSLGSETLTISGEAIKILSSNVANTDLIFRKLTLSTIVHAFEGSSEVVIFISSIKNSLRDFQFDLDMICSIIGLVEFTILGAAGDPLSNQSRATIALGGFNPDQSGNISFQLEPFETIMITVATGSTQRSSVIEGNTEPNTLFGNIDRNIIIGYSANDTLYGRAGNDFLNGNYGDDSLFGGRNPDRLLGDNNSDLLYGGFGSDFLFGGRGSDLIYGGKGNDRIFGGEHNDTIVAGDGQDTIKGGFGDDIFTGGSGHDTFLFSLSNFGFDVITDFDVHFDKICFFDFNPHTQVIESAISAYGTVIMFGESSILVEDVFVSDSSQFWA